MVIVGGGIAGLSAAWKLARSGFRDFTVLELEPDAGGNARWGANDVTAYPWGAHYLPVPPPEATAVRELVEEMGLVEGYGPDGAPRYDPRHLCHAPQERRFVGGQWRAGLSARDILESLTATGLAPEGRAGRVRGADGDLSRLPRRAGPTGVRPARGAQHDRPGDRRARSPVDGRVLRSRGGGPHPTCGGTSTTAAATTTAAPSTRPRPGRAGTTSARAPRTSST